MKDIISPLKVLATFRIIYPLCIFFEILNDRNMLLSRTTNLDCHPIGIFQVLNLPIIGADNFNFFLSLTCIGLLLFSAGALSQFSGLASTLAFFWVFGSNLGCGFSASLAYTNWQHSIVVFNLLILSLSPAGKLWSIDSYFSKRPNSNKAYLYVFLLKFNLAYSYFAGGIAKLQYGFDWSNGYTLQGYLLYAALKLEKYALIPLASHLSTLQVISIIVLATEILFPLALFSSRLSCFFVGGSLLFQIIFWFLIDLRWMRYFGWSYLIYFIELAFFILISLSSASRKKWKLNLVSSNTKP